VHEAKLRQHVPFNRAAYSIRDGRQERARMTWQIEIAGRAAQVPYYPQDWYDDVADLLGWCTDNLGVPWRFADFDIMIAGAFAPQRWDFNVFAGFAGFLGHGHAGRGIDSHWDPGRLDVERLGEPDMPREQWNQMIQALFEGRPDEFQPPGGYTYWQNLDSDSPEWDTDFWPAFVRAISLTT